MDLFKNNVENAINKNGIPTTSTSLIASTYSKSLMDSTTSTFSTT